MAIREKRWVEIEKVKRNKMSQKELGDISDEDFEKEMEEMNKEIEEELGEEIAPNAIKGEQIEEIVKLQDELREKIPMTALSAYIKKKYGAEQIEDLTEEQGDDVILEIRRIKEKHTKKEKKEQAERGKTEKEEESTKKWQVECDGTTYNVLPTEEAGKYLVREEGGIYYEVIPSQSLCSCPGKKYKGKCKHLHSPEFIEFWKSIGELKEESREIAVKEIEGVDVSGLITEERAAKLIRVVLGDVTKESIVTYIPSVGEMLNADAVIALGNALGIQRDVIEGPVVEDIDADGEEIPAVRVKVEAAYKHPLSSVLLKSQATVIQKFGIEDLKGRRRTDLSIRAAQSKAERKAILRVLPITHKGLLEKIKKAYGWK